MYVEITAIASLALILSLPLLELAYEPDPIFIALLAVVCLSRAETPTEHVEEKVRPLLLSEC